MFKLLLGLVAFAFCAYIISLVITAIGALFEVLFKYWWALALCISIAVGVYLCTGGKKRKRTISTKKLDTFADKESLNNCKKQQTQKPLTTSIEDDKNLTITTNQQLQEFYDSHELLKSFITKVVGVTYPNDDGSSRQEILSNCLPGEPVWLSWQSFNGAPACAVMSDYGQIGYLKADLAADLYDDYVAWDLNNIIVFSSKISDITGGERGLSYGCNIMVSIYAPASPYRDEMLPVAVDLILETGQASVTQLQKRLHIGYSRASRLMDELEENGIVGPFRGSKPREILITKEQWDLQKKGL